MITLQYLEPGPHLTEITPRMAGDKLRAALDILPIDILLLGWNLPGPLVEVCREETARRGVKLYRWQPLLTGDGVFRPWGEWQTRNLDGHPLMGPEAREEFTFVCPNHPEARAAALDHLEAVSGPEIYDGIFFDRMRFPSPAANPVEALGCFCPHCERTAADSGLDLDKVRTYLRTAPAPTLFHDVLEPGSITPFTRFLDFRQKVITRFVSEAAKRVRALGLEIGLDLFTTSLMRLVGQDLDSLPLLADWSKLMIYTHAFGPAALPYELAQLTDWLSAEIPFSSDGPDGEPVCREYGRARQLAPSGTTLLAGIEMVEIPGVCQLTPDEIVHDLNVLNGLNADGLAISWDLWQIPLERLELVREIWGR